MTNLQLVVITVVWTLLVVFLIAFIVKRVVTWLVGRNFKKWRD